LRLCIACFAFSASVVDRWLVVAGWLAGDFGTWTTSTWTWTSLFLDSGLRLAGYLFFRPSDFPIRLLNFCMGPVFFLRATFSGSRCELGWSKVWEGKLQLRFLMFGTAMDPMLAEGYGSLGGIFIVRVVF